MQLADLCEVRLAVSQCVCVHVCLRWEEEYTARVDLQDKVSELEEVNVPLSSPDSPPTCTLPTFKTEGPNTGVCVCVCVCV